MLVFKEGKEMTYQSKGGICFRYMRGKYSIERKGTNAENWESRLEWIDRGPGNPE